MINAIKIAAADAELDKAIAESEQQYGKADADDVRHHAKFVAERLGIAFLINDEGNVEWHVK